MELLVEKYADKLRRAGLCERPALAGLDAELAWNADADPALVRAMAPVFGRLDMAGFAVGRPAGALGPVVDFLAAHHPGGFTPGDTETRTFLHHLPVVERLDADSVAGALSAHKAVIVRDGADGGEVGAHVAAHGGVTPEQAFVSFSSVCFSCFVLFFMDYLRLARAGAVEPRRREAFERARELLEPMRREPPELERGPFADAGRAHRAMAEAGRATVEYGLVDSYFGNVSALVGGTIHISQTGSSLDELEGLIDPCPLDGSSTACLTASSELTAHAGVYGDAAGPGPRAILHGHPRFTVIATMDCPEIHQTVTCETGRRGQCHVTCSKHRELPGGIPIVPGEVGTGPTGLARTLPAAMRCAGAAAVWGHGLFTSGPADFNEPFARLLETENGCRARYFEEVDALDRASART